MFLNSHSYYVSIHAPHGGRLFKKISSFFIITIKVGLFNIIFYNISMKEEMYTGKLGGLKELIHRFNEDEHKEKIINELSHDDKLSNKTTIQLITEFLGAGA